MIHRNTAERFESLSRRCISLAIVALERGYEMLFVVSHLKIFLWPFSQTHSPRQFPPRSIRRLFFFITLVPQVTQGGNTRTLSNKQTHHDSWSDFICVTAGTKPCARKVVSILAYYYVIILVKPVLFDLAYDTAKFGNIRDRSPYYHLTEYKATIVIQSFVEPDCIPPSLANVIASSIMDR